MKYCPSFLFPTALDVCVFMKDGSVHELHLENVWMENAEELLLKVEDCLDIPPEARDMFSLWITSPLLRKYLIVTLQVIYLMPYCYAYCACVH